MFSKLLKNVDLRRRRVAAFFIALLLAISLASSTAFANEEEALAHNAKGIEYFNAGDYQNAIKEFTIASQLDTTRAVYNYNIANTYFTLKNYDATIEYLEKGMQIEPNDSGLYTLRGRAYQAKGNIEKALEDFNKALNLKPKDAYTYIFRGYFYQSQGNNEKALEDFNKGIDLDRNVAWFYSWRAQFYESQGQPKEAAKDYNICGNLEFNNGNYEDAVESYTSAINLDNNNAEYYTNRGIAYGKLKRYEEAHQDFNRALTINSSDARVYKERALICKEQGNNAQAEKDYLNAGSWYYGQANNTTDIAEKEKLVNESRKMLNAAIELNPQCAEAYYWLGSDDNKLSQYENAIKNFNKALQLKIASKWEDEVYNALGWSNYWLEEYEKAIENFNKAISKNNGYEQSYEYRALSYYYLNDYLNALRDFVKLIQINPTQEEIYNEFITICEGATGLKRTDKLPDPAPIPIPEFNVPPILLALIITIAFEFVLYIAYEVKSGTMNSGVVVRKIVQILIIVLIIFVVNAIAKDIPDSNLDTYFLIGLLLIEIGLILDDAGNLGVPIPEDLKNFIKGFINKVKGILRIE